MDITNIERIFKTIGKTQVRFPLDLALLTNYLEDILCTNCDYNMNRYCLSILKLMIKYDNYITSYIYQYNKQNILNILLSKLTTSTTLRPLNLISKIMRNNSDSSLIENFYFI